MEIVNCFFLKTQGLRAYPLVLLQNPTSDTFKLRSKTQRYYIDTMLMTPPTIKTERVAKKKPKRKRCTFQWSTTHTQLSLSLVSITRITNKNEKSDEWIKDRNNQTINSSWTKKTIKRDSERKSGERGEREREKNAHSHLSKWNTLALI